MVKLTIDSDHQKAFCSRKVVSWASFKWLVQPLPPVHTSHLGCRILAIRAWSCSPFKKCIWMHPVFVRYLFFSAQLVTLPRANNIPHYHFGQLLRQSYGGKSKARVLLRLLSERYPARTGMAGAYRAHLDETIAFLRALHSITDIFWYDAAVHHVSSLTLGWLEIYAVSTI